MKTVFELQEIRKIYRMGESDVHALDGVNLHIYENDYLAILGPSGSGKSTLMHILGFMDQATDGKLLFEEEDVTHISAYRRALFRAQKIGFVFQSFNLLPRLNVLENVLLPVSYSRKKDSNAEDRAYKALERVGMQHRATHQPNQLSGGERQRVAIARALINDPAMILADEPTGNLDSKNVGRILDLFSEIHAEGNTVLLVTHDLDVAKYTKRIVHVLDGKINRQETNE